MATIGRSPILFFVTSPRTPWRFIPELELLNRVCSGKQWNQSTQTEFMTSLVNEDFYMGSKSLKDPALSARDRINRAPKAYGFVKLNPFVEITGAGQVLLTSPQYIQEEVLLRQLLKFQLPSVYHNQTAGSTTNFRVKPFLEILRLIDYFGSLTFDEVSLFGMQLTDYRKFDSICNKINKFRELKQNSVSFGGYKRFYADYTQRELTELFHDDIVNGRTYTRESEDGSIEKFLQVKKNNLRDYTDACFRYLCATNYVMISQSHRSIEIAPDKKNAVKFLLQTINPEPCYVYDIDSYENYLYNPNIPALYNDDKGNLINNISNLVYLIDRHELANESIWKLKEIEHYLLNKRKDAILTNQVASIKNFEQFDDILDVFTKIKNKEYLDNPLQFEWNTWRAMTMLDGGYVQANLKFDNYGNPVSTAAGNKADIVCDYGDFCVNVEVTLQGGHKQYESEGEPVARHVGQQSARSNKPTFCLFIAPSISQATYAHFYVLYKVNVNFYGGFSNIIPLTLDTFQHMIRNCRAVNYVPEPQHIKALFDIARQLSNQTSNETEWFNKINDIAKNWLSIPLTHVDKG